jgi:hypothetical protein
MPESVVREELESLNIRVQGVMQLRSGRRDQDPANDRPATPHFIVSVTRGPEVSRVRSLTELCGLRVSVESYVALKGPLQCKRCQRFGHTQRNCGYAPRCAACGVPTSPVDVLTRGNSLIAAAAEEATRRFIGPCEVERGEGCHCKGSVPERVPPRIAPSLRKPRRPARLSSRLTLARDGITSSEGGVSSLPPIHP